MSMQIIEGHACIQVFKDEAEKEAEKIFNYFHGQCQFSNKVKIDKPEDILTKWPGGKYVANFESEYIVSCDYHGSRYLDQNNQGIPCNTRRCRVFYSFSRGNFAKGRKSTLGEHHVREYNHQYHQP